MTSQLLAYLRLFRIANVFTSISDVAMGFLFVAIISPAWSWVGLALACAASALMYTAGMVLNDAFDAEVDADERPGRPIPSGAISRGRAMVIGWTLLVAGGLLASSIGLVTGGDHLPWRPATMALLLAMAIVGYDSFLKRTPAGPLAMGACRFFNILMAMSAAAPVVGESYVAAGYGGPELLVAGGIGIYIVGVTLFARTEARQSSRPMLIMAFAVMIAGLGMLCCFQYTSALQDRFADSIKSYGPLLIALVSAVVIRRCIDAIINPAPLPVQRAIKQAIVSLISLDAVLCLMVAPSQPYFALFVLALLGPMIFLGRWIPST